jgi:hypothetical protein
MDVLGELFLAGGSRGCVAVLSEYGYWILLKIGANRAVHGCRCDDARPAEPGRRFIFDGHGPPSERSDVNSSEAAAQAAA